MIKIIDAILAIKSDAQVTIRGNDVNNITWDDGNPTSITNADIGTKQTELQTAYDAEVYARTRATAYASTGDQLDMQYWDSINDTTTWKDHVASIKAAHPKP
jgi:hypothetical protein